MPAFDSFDGVRLSYDEAGDGAPVLLLHGFASNSYFNWVRPGVVDMLAGAGYRAVALDLRGHGASDKPHDPAAYGDETLARDARSLLDRLGIDDVHVAGFSLGARTALLLLVSEPRVRSAILAGIGGETVRILPGRAEIFAQALLAPDKSTIADPTARSFRDFADTTRADKAALAAVQRGARVPVPDELRSVSVGVLFLCAENDPIAGPPDELAASIPGARVVTVPGTHLNVVNNPLFQKAMLDFLDHV